MSNKTNLFLLLFLFLLCSFLYLYNLDARDFWAPDEGDFAQIAKELDNNYIVPHLNNKPCGEKPPLFYYMIKLSSKIFHVLKDEISMRIPSGAFAIGGILFFFITLKNFFNIPLAIISSCILLSNPLYYWQARYLQVDMIFSVLLFSSLLFFFWFYKTKKIIFYYLCFICLALAFMAKGPISVVLAVPVIVIFLFLQKNIRLLLVKETVVGIIIFIAIVVPWYLLVYYKEGLPYLYENIIRQNFIRFFDAWSHKRPFYYYFTTLPLDFFPWSIFLPMGIYIAFTEYKKNPYVIFFLVWFIWMFLFFSLSSGKISKYMLPLLPSLSLLSSLSFLKDKSRYNLIALIFFLVLQLILAGFFFLYKLHIYPEFFIERIIIGILCVALAFAIYFFLKHRSMKKVFIAIFIFMITLFSIGNLSVYAKWNNYKSPKAFCENIKPYVQKGIPWVYYGSMRGVYIYYIGSFAHHIDEHDIKKLEKFKGRMDNFFILTRNRNLEEIHNTLGKVEILLKERIGDTIMVFCRYIKGN